MLFRVGINWCNTPDLKKKNLQICNESLNASRGSYSFWSSLKETSTQKTEAFHGLTVKVWMTQVTVFFLLSLLNVAI